MRRTTASILVALLAGSPAWGWGEIGHRAIARIAADQLTQTAQTHVARILGIPDNRQALSEALAEGSVWADQIKGNTGTAKWHYINLGIRDHRDDEEARCPDENCLPAKIRFFRGVLQEHSDDAKPDPRWTEADALRFLVHLVGDAHQPLHTANDADEGALCEKLRMPFDESQNMHAVWDSGIIWSMHLSDTALAHELEDEIGRLHERQQHQWAGGDEMDWIWESHELAIREIYTRMHVPVEMTAEPHGCADAPAPILNFEFDIDTQYLDAMKPLVRTQLIKAGLRLGRVLNEIL
jgi:hypothetical protein